MIWENKKQQYNSKTELSVTYGVVCGYKGVGYNCVKGNLYLWLFWVTSRAWCDKLAHFWIIMLYHRFVCRPDGRRKNIIWILFYVLGTSLHVKQMCNIEPHRVAHSNNIFWIKRETVWKLIFTHFVYSNTVKISLFILDFELMNVNTVIF